MESKGVDGAAECLGEGELVLWKPEEKEGVEEVGAKACVVPVVDVWYLAESPWKVTGR